METGNFGKLRDAYVAARQAFPQDFIEYIWQSTTSLQPIILDIGCGTGIATRQLAEHPGASVIGCDVDKGMIEAAQETFITNIKYVTAPANKLPFNSNLFDIVTAFSAFHWFKDEQSLAEIQRVLKKGGRFFVINKNDIRGFRRGYKTKLANLLGEKLPDPKDNYDPSLILNKAGFVDMITKRFISEEQFSPAGALQHIQSAAAWSVVPKEKEYAARELMKNHIAETMNDGKVTRKLEVVVVSGKKA